MYNCDEVEWSIMKSIINGIKAKTRLVYAIIEISTLFE